MGAVVNLTLYRRPSQGDCTIGELEIDGAFECYTLEDRIREEAGRPVAEWKVKGETAIPAGRYRVTITFSQRFQRELPLLNAVPGFEGVRIHPGNTAADTEGCILVGTQVARDAVLNSRQAFAHLFDKIDAALELGDEVFIDVLN